MFTESKIFKDLIINKENKRKAFTKKIQSELIELSNKIVKQQRMSNSFYVVGSSKLAKILKK